MSRVDYQDFINARNRLFRREANQNNNEKVIKITQKEADAEVEALKLKERLLAEAKKANFDPLREENSGEVDPKDSSPIRVFQQRISIWDVSIL